MLSRPASGHEPLWDTFQIFSATSEGKKRGRETKEKEVTSIDPMQYVSALEMDES